MRYVMWILILMTTCCPSRAWRGTPDQIRISVESDNWVQINSVEYRSDEMVLNVVANHSGWHVQARLQTILDVAESVEGSSPALLMNGCALSDEYMTVHVDEFNTPSVVFPVYLTTLPGPRHIEESIVLDGRVLRNELPSFLTESMRDRARDDVADDQGNIEHINVPEVDIDLRALPTGSTVTEIVEFGFGTNDREIAAKIISEYGGAIRSGGKDVTLEIASRFSDWLNLSSAHHVRRDETLKISAYICRQRRNAPCEHIFTIADEMALYMESSPGGRFAKNWQRAVRVVDAESIGFRYWAKNTKSSAAGLWQFLDSTANRFGAQQIRDVNAALARSKRPDEIMDRIGSISRVLWATGKTSVYDLMHPHPKERSLPTVGSPRSDSFNRLVQQRKSEGMSDSKAFVWATEDVIRFQTAMGCRLLDIVGWGQWEVCTRFGV